MAWRGRRLLEIVYVTVYAYNAPYRVLGCFAAGAHQADVEHLTVRTDEAGRRVFAVRYSSHGTLDGEWLRLVGRGPRALERSLGRAVRQLLPRAVAEWLYRHISPPWWRHPIQVSFVGSFTSG